MNEFLEELFKRIKNSNCGMSYLARLTGVSYNLLRLYTEEGKYESIKLSILVKLLPLYDLLEVPIDDLVEFEVKYKQVLSDVAFPKAFIPKTNLCKLPELLVEVLTLAMKIGSSSEGESTGTLMSIKDHLMSGLNEEERKVLQYRISVMPQTFQQIGDALELTRQRVEQIEKKAIERIKGNANLIKFITSSYEVSKELEETKCKLNKIKTTSGVANKDEDTFFVRDLNIQGKRLRGYFIENHISTVGQLLRDHSVRKMCGCKNVGVNTIDELQSTLIQKGFRPLREY